jgi:hypothetical protein
MVRSDDDLLCVVPTKTVSESFPLGERLGLSKAVGDELQVLKANNFTKGEATAGQLFAVGGDDKI